MSIFNQLVVFFRSLIVIALFFSAFGASVSLASQCVERVSTETSPSLDVHFEEGQKYPRVYNSVLELFVPHIQNRKFHSAQLPGGDVRIADLGAGTALVSRHLIKDDPGRIVENFDDSAVMFAVAEREGTDPKRLHKSNMLEPRFSNGERVPAEYFDGAVSNNALYILRSEAEVLALFQEAHRMIKKGSVFSVGSMAKVSQEDMSRFLTRMTSEIVAMERDGEVESGSADIFFNTNVHLTKDDPTVFTIAEIDKLAEKAGFKLIAQSSAYYGSGFLAAFVKL